MLTEEEYSSAALESLLVLVVVVVVVVADVPYYLGHVGHHQIAMFHENLSRIQFHSEFNKIKISSKNVSLYLYSHINLDICLCES